MPNDFEKNERGFELYGNGTCTYGIDWRFQASSSAGDLRVWLFVKGQLQGGPKGEGLQDGALHLSVDDLRKMRGQLDAIITHAESDEHWRNSEEYKREWCDDEETP